MSRVRATPTALLALASLVLLATRLHAATVVGFGDSEALYASWALHPQPAYLDHPALVAVLARALGGGGAPTPAQAHVVSAVLATAVPWLAFLAARAAGASARHAAVGGLVLALAPITAVGLFGMTPDLLLAPLWLGAIGLVSYGLGEVDPAGPLPASRAAALVAGGLAAGLSVTAKAPGALLVLALAWALAGLARLSPRTPAERAARAAARSPWPWAGLAAGLLPAAPVLAWERAHGFPMLRHRLVDTQAGAGFAPRNILALAGGQLAYLSPVLAVLAVLVARDLLTRRREDVASRLLFATAFVPAVPLLALCLWSRVAEPHWLAPAWLAVLVHGTRRGAELPRAAARLVRPALGVAAAATAAAHLYVLVPASARLAPEGADMRLDIASELTGWPEVHRAVRAAIRTAATTYDPESREVVVVGPHWTVCGQLHAGLPGVRVGCATPVPDDFDGWLPRARWRGAEQVLFVTDTRFPETGDALLPGHVLIRRWTTTVERGGRPTRTFTLSLFARRAQG